MTTSKVLLGSTAIVALALLGSSCKTAQEVEVSSTDSNQVADTMMEKKTDSMETNDSNTMVEGATTYTVNSEESNLHWLAKKVTGQHQGDIKISNGTAQIKDGEIVGGEFTINMDSMTLTNEEPNEGLMNHLRSDDFFSVESHPNSTFVITSVKKLDGNNYEVTGNLTIKGITNPLTFPAEINITDNQVTATGVITVDRTLYDMRFLSVKFFDNIAEKAVDDTFTLDLDLVANAS